MKPRIPVWLALTFLMLFLVLLAAFVFTLQGRGVLEDRLEAMEAELTTQSETVVDLELTATVQAAGAADTEATRDAYSATVSENQTNIEQLQAQLQAESASAQATIDAQQAAQAQDAETRANQPPQVELFSPENGITLAPNEAIELLVSVTDPQGVESVTLTVNNDVIGRYTELGRLLFTTKEMWSASDEGTYTFAASATNVAGVASDVVTATVTVVDREGRLRDVIASVQREVEEARGLTATEPITLTLYTKQELRENFEEIFLEDVTEEEARQDVIELYAFDFIELDYDLYATLLDLYSASVLGFYDPDTKELVVVSDDAEVTPSERLTLAHEINHALQDQVFGLAFDENDSEASFALRSLAEGDATLLQTVYLQSGYLTEAETDQLFREYATQESPDFSNVPDIIIRQQEFPYLAGLEFARTLYATGGFDAINAAWDNPPVTTEQIMHPELYIDFDAPDLVTLPPLSDTLGAEWSFIAEDTMGEYSLALYLDQNLSERGSLRAAAGWGGDRYAVYWNDAQEQVVMVMKVVWDSDQEDDEFAQAYDTYASSKYNSPAEFQDDGSRCWRSADITCLYEIDDETIVIRAPNRETVVAVLGEVQ